jgi:hypothetical protein
LTAKSRETLKWSLRIVVLTSMGLCIGVDVNRMFVDPPIVALTRSYALWDNWLDQSTRRGIFLKFEDFPQTAAGYVQNIYFRSVYVVYPRRSLVSGSPVTINNGLELLKNNSLPSDAWLLDHGVDSVMSIVMDPRRGVPVPRDVRWLGE